MTALQNQRDLYFKHIVLVDTVYPCVLKFILNKLCPLNSEATLFHKLLEQYPSEGKLRRSYYPEEIKRLKDNSCDSFDTILLFKLIRELCPQDALRSWLNDDCPLRSGETYYDKLVDKYGSDENIEEQYTQIAVLKSQDPSSFDISLLNKLVKDLCPHYTFNDSLKKVKDRRNIIFRNSFKHNIETLGNSAAVEESRCIILTLLDDAKQGFNIDHEDIEAEKSEVNIKYDQILNNDLILSGDQPYLRH